RPLLPDARAGASDVSHAVRLDSLQRAARHCVRGVGHVRADRGYLRAGGLALLRPRGRRPVPPAPPQGPVAAVPRAGLSRRPCNLHRRVCLSRRERAHRRSAVDRRHARHRARGRSCLLLHNRSPGPQCDEMSSHCGTRPTYVGRVPPRSNVRRAGSAARRGGSHKGHKAHEEKEHKGELCDLVPSWPSCSLWLPFFVPFAVDYHQPMIKVIDIESRPKTRVPEGHVTQLLDQSADGTRVHVAIREIDPGKAYRVAASDRTQIVYVLEGTDARIAHTTAGATADHTAQRRSGIYLEPSEEATVSASATPLTLLVVTVPKHAGKATGGAAPSGYFFEE